MSGKNISLHKRKTLLILDGKYRLVIERPIYSQVWIIPDHASLMFRSIVIGSVVKKLGLFRQNDKAMSKTFRHPKLMFVFSTQVSADPLSKRR
ncbi:hypothetical protein D3C77_73870 [compost metagenome]